MHQGGRGMGMMALKKLVAGNWKMHGVAADLGEIAEIADATRAVPQVDVALCVPAILIERAVRAVPGFAIGGQDVHFAEKGAHTGCTSAVMLADAGASLTIVGPSIPGITTSLMRRSIVSPRARMSSASSPFSAVRTV